MTDEEIIDELAKGLKAIKLTATETLEKINKSLGVDEVRFE